MVSGTSTHFCNAETTIELWENLYGPAFKLQRAACALDPDAPGLLICDGSQLHMYDIYIYIYIYIYKVGTQVTLERSLIVMVGVGDGRYSVCRNILMFAFPILIASSCLYLVVRVWCLVLILVPSCDYLVII
jgi:hypothetical protein